MKQKTLRDIVEEHNKFRKFNIIKPKKYDRRTWEFQIVDERSPYGGTVGKLEEYRHQITTIRHDDHFFTVYKMTMLDGESPEYLVDIKRANHRNSVEKFVNSTADYLVHSNDISTVKDGSSFRVSRQEMSCMKINNYLDLCHKFGQFSAIGTGITRDIRNLIVLDIDVDCETSSNKAEVNRILLEFAKCNALPDFIIKNHNTHHIQMQWLVQDVQYKEIDQNVIKNTIKRLKDDSNKRKEIDLFKTTFSKLTDWGVDYRKFSSALTYISKKNKFGDKHYTFWKAKNFESARLGLYNLELMMPYYKDGEIKYISKEEIDSLLGTKEARQEYFNEAPTIAELYKRTSSLVDIHIKKIDDKKIKRIKDGDEEIDENSCKNKTIISKEDIEKGNFGKSRNTFVLNCTRTTTWKVAREYKFRNSNDITALNDKERQKFKNEIYSRVWEQFNKMDTEYNGKWPDTSNYGAYSREEFDTTFNNSYFYAISAINDFSYTDEQRERSIESRRLSIDVNLCILDQIMGKYNKKVKREIIWTEMNQELTKIGLKNISFGSFKRRLSEWKKMTDEDTKEKYDTVADLKRVREQDLSDALESSDADSRKVKSCQKRLKQVNITIKEVI